MTIRREQMRQKGKETLMFRFRYLSFSLYTKNVFYLKIDPKVHDDASAHHVTKLPGSQV